MIPYRDENRVGGFPAMTYSLIALNLFVFFKEAAAGAQGAATLEAFVRALGTTPYVLTHHLQMPPPAPHPE
ncbi:MAG: rhomboid family intramembrane serine protease, partial [Candidatus Eremiobacteraeota bacterium]|nr:rhomboid family intramembrane serine protease [Candidatus Eremiobacteraeota bacterium]